MRFWMGLCLIWLAHLSIDFMLGVWPIYKTLVNLDLVVAGLIASLGIFIGEGLQLVFGVLSDKGYHQLLLIVGLALTATIPFLSYVHNEWLLLLMVVSAFVGSGAFHPSASGLVMGGPLPYKSFLIALFALGGMIGAASSQLIFSKLYSYFEGETWFLVVPGIVLAASCAFYRFHRVEGMQPKTRSVRLKEILETLIPHRKRLTLLYVIQVCLQMIVLSFSFLLSDILQLKGYAEWFCLGGGYSLFIVGAILTTLPIGYCVDRVGYRSILAGIVMVSAISLWLFLNVDNSSLVAAVGLLLVLGGSIGVIVPVAVAGGVQGVPAHARSFVSALFMGGATCLAAFGPVLTTLVASSFEQQAPIEALEILSTLFLVCLVLIYYLPKSCERVVNQMVRNCSLVEVAS